MLSGALYCKINNQKLMYLKHNDKMLFNGVKIRFTPLSSLKSVNGNAFVNVPNSSNNIKFSLTCKVENHDQRGLFGYDTGRSHYWGSKNGLWEVENETISGGISNVEQFIEMSYNNGTITLDTQYGQLTHDDGVSISGPWKFPKGLGSSYEGSMTIYRTNEEYDLKIDINGTITNLKMAKLKRNTNNGNIGDVGFVDIDNNQFYPNVGSVDFIYTEYVG